MIDGSSMEYASRHSQKMEDRIAECLEQAAIVITDISIDQDDLTDAETEHVKNEAIRRAGRVGKPIIRIKTTGECDRLIEIGMTLTCVYDRNPVS